MERQETSVLPSLYFTTSGVWMFHPTCFTSSWPPRDQRNHSTLMLAFIDLHQGLLTSKCQALSKIYCSPVLFLCSDSSGASLVSGGECPVPILSSRTQAEPKSWHSLSSLWRPTTFESQKTNSLAVVVKEIWAMFQSPCLRSSSKILTRANIKESE